MRSMRFSFLSHRPLDAGVGSALTGPPSIEDRSNGF